MELNQVFKNGKHKGSTLKEVSACDPMYIHFMMETTKVSFPEEVAERVVAHIVYKNRHVTSKPKDYYNADWDLGLCGQS